MNEVAHSSTPDGSPPEHLPPLEADNFGDQELHRGQEAAEGLKEAQEAWLERRGVDPASIPRLTMGQREFKLFRNVPSTYLDYTTDLYEIPQDDQVGAQYALVAIKPDDPNLPHEHKLTIVTEADFGTTIDRERIDMDFQIPDPGPDSPLMPESGGAYKTVNIADTLVTSAQGLRTLTEGLMRGITTDPLSDHYGDIGVRAGGLAPGQQDAYVWTYLPFFNAVALTMAFPGKYDSVCVVRGQRREAANGKAGMAQIVDPEVVLRVEGENLRELQRIYQELYHNKPDFALTEEQSRGRDELFNDYLAHQISSEARSNRARKDDEYRTQQPPQLRAREIPRP